MRNENVYKQVEQLQRQLKTIQRRLLGQDMVATEPSTPKFKVDDIVQLRTNKVKFIVREILGEKYANNHRYLCELITRPVHTELTENELVLCE